MRTAEESARILPRHLHEECGVFGIFAPQNEDLAGLVYYGLYALQHRGQRVRASPSTMTACSPSGGTWAWSVWLCLPGVWRSWDRSIAVGHVRYATTGSDAALNGSSPW